MRVLLISDIHVGALISPANTRRRLSPLRDLQADLVVFTGDLSSDRVWAIPAGGEILRELAPKGIHLAVLGNHDRWTAERLTVDALKANGFEPLMNRAKRIEIRGAPIWVAGVNDPTTGADDLSQALSRVPRNAFCILLAHGPDILRDPLSRRPDLLLSGHTHGGQVVLPMLGPIACNSRFGPRYASGLFRVERSTLYVTRGLGEVTVPLRVNCRPEIVLLELRARPSRP